MRTTLKVFLAAVVLLAIGIAGWRLIDASDEDRIAEVIEEAATSDDPAICTELVTQARLEQVSGLPGPAAISACESTASEEGLLADAVEVSDVVVDGDDATARVRYEGSSLNGSTVEVALVRVGGEWLLDRSLGIVELDRAGLEQGLPETFSSPPTSLSAAGAECATREILSLSDAGIERALVSSDTSIFAKAIVACDRESYTAGLERDLISFGNPERLVMCVGDELDRRTDEEFVELVLDPVAYSRISIDCDRAGFLAAYGAQVEGFGPSPQATDCVVSKLDELSDSGLAQIAVDDTELDRIFPACGIGG